MLAHLTPAAADTKTVISEFINAQPATMTATQIAEKAETMGIKVTPTEAGLKFTRALVYNIRHAGKAKPENTTATAE